jgi:toxin ParE1/3/4
MAYLITEPAEADIDEVLFYIAEENLKAALSVYDGLLHCFEMLAQTPKAGPERKEFRRDARSFPEGNYLIFYRIINSNDVEILRVLHGARDLDEIFS